MVRKQNTKKQMKKMIKQLKRESKSRNAPRRKAFGKIKRTPIPHGVTFTASGSAGEVRQQGKETFLRKDINLQTLNVGDADNGSFFVYRINPGDWPWFKDRAQGYRFWRLVSMTAEYNGSTSNSTNGRIYLAYQPECSAGTPSNGERLSDLEHSINGSVHAPRLAVNVPPSEVHALNRYLRIRQGPTATPLENTDGGLIIAYLTGLQNDPAKEIGVIRFRVTVAVKSPTIPSTGILPQSSAVAKLTYSPSLPADGPVPYESIDYLYDTMDITSTAGTCSLQDSSIAHVEFSGNSVLTGAGQVTVEVKDATSGIVLESAVVNSDTPGGGTETYPISLSALVGLTSTAVTAWQIWVRVSTGAGFALTDATMIVRLVNQGAATLQQLGLLGSYENYRRRFPQYPEARLLEKYTSYSGPRAQHPGNDEALRAALVRVQTARQERKTDIHAEIKSTLSGLGQSKQEEDEESEAEYDVVGEDPEVVELRAKLKALQNKESNA